ncbi:glycosyltransferase family 4 protein [bacterium]|nr:glycosyltransferase family 4 protein [bacterium]
MKILFLTHYFPPEGNAPASRVYEMAKRWVGAGHEVTVITCAPNVPNGEIYEGYQNKLRQVEQIDGIRVVRVWTYMAANKGAFLRIINFLSYMVSAVVFGIFEKRSDIVIATSPQFFCGWAGIILSRLRGLKCILEIRDIWPESIVAVGAGLGDRTIRFLEWLEMKMYKYPCHIVTVGRGYQGRLIEKGVPKKKIDVVTNGVDRDFYQVSPVDKELLLEHGLEGKFVCSYIGTIGMACGLDVVIRAAEILSQAGETHFHFLLVGDGAMREELEQRCRDQKLNNITWVGRKPKQDMPRYLAASDVCLVHLKNTELFKTVLPSKIFEACAMERPIILGVEGNAAEVVQEAQAGICIEPENEIELVAALRRLHADPELCQHYGRSGRSHVLEHYDRDQLAADYLKIIQEVLL